MNSKLIPWALYIVFIVLKSINDAEYIRKQKSKGINHLIEWFMVAIVASITSYAISTELINIILFDIVLVPITWIITDALVNFALGENPFLHVGSGWWDQFFKLHLPEKFVPYAIWILKILLIIIAWYVWSRLLIKN